MFEVQDNYTKRAIRVITNQGTYELNNTNITNETPSKTVEL